MEEFTKQCILFLLALITGGGLTHLVKESDCNTKAGDYRLRFSVKEVDTGVDLDGDGKNDIEQQIQLGIVKETPKV